MSEGRILGVFRCRKLESAAWVMNWMNAFMERSEHSVKKSAGVPDELAGNKYLRD